MVNPQKENGYTSIANELLEALAKINISFGNAQILYAIIRKTYGWQKKEDKISISQLESMTGLSKRMVIYCLQNLESKRIINIKRNVGRGKKNEINIINLQKNYKKWVVQENSSQYKNALKKRKEFYGKYQKGVVQEKRGSARNGNLVVQEIGNNSGFLAHTKETITKETTKETSLHLSESPKTETRCEIPYQIKKDPLSKMIYAYKIASGNKIEDRIWDKTEWKRNTKAAQEMLVFFNNDWKLAVKCLEDLSNKFKKNGFTWTFETICKHKVEWYNKNKENL